jgi:hypothetical protein
VWGGSDDAAELYGAVIGVVTWSVNKKARLERSRSFCLDQAGRKFGALVIFQVLSYRGNLRCVTSNEHIAIFMTFMIHNVCCVASR